MTSMSLVIVDTDSYVLANAAVHECMKKFSFNEVLVFSDDASKWNGMKVHTIPKISSMGDYDNFILRDLPKHIETTHFMITQFDGFILNPSEWSPLFLHYDYIGAPWPAHNHGKYNVGNGGFSLRTKKLADFIAKHGYDYSREKLHEDLYVCQKMRPALEKNGMHFAPDTIASHFSAESYLYRYPTFGFHNIRFMPLVYQNNLDFLLDNLTDRVVKAHGSLIIPNLKNVSQSHCNKLISRMESL